MTSKELAIFCARLAADKKAENIVVIAMTKLAGVTDYFVICSGNAERQLQNIAYELEFTLKKQHNILCRGMEGYNQGHWILLDYVDVVVHLYLNDARQYYEIEDLWADAPRVVWENQ
jgi:ribosome-associated protein